MIELKNNPAGNFFLLAGPCVIEGEEMAMRIAERVVKSPKLYKFHTYSKALTARLTAHVWIRLQVSVTKSTQSIKKST